MTLPKWHVNLLTLFPEMFPGPLGHSLAGRALKNKIWECNIINIRDFADDKHQTVDDIPYGGGAGMVMKPDIVAKAIDSVHTKSSRLIYMSPRGTLLNQELAYSLSQSDQVTIICGRYEGLDQRVIDQYDIEEISAGDFILSGGEIAALTLMDSVIRLLPGVIGNSDTLNEESFGKNEDYTGLLEYPLYTRPFEWNGLSVPSVLTSGNHKKIEQWRLSQAESITQQRRPDLWQFYCDMKKKK